MLGESEGDAWPRRGEIDILEWSAQLYSRDEMQSALHTERLHGGSAKVARQHLKDACGAFHTFKVLWTAERIGFGQDDGAIRTLATRPNNADASVWPFNRDFRLILNVAVGGDLGGPPPNPGSVAEMEIQWIRVYPLTENLAHNR